MKFKGGNIAWLFAGLLCVSSMAARPLPWDCARRYGNLVPRTNVPGGVILEGEYSPSAMDWHPREGAAAVTYEVPLDVIRPLHPTPRPGFPKPEGHIENLAGLIKENGFDIRKSLAVLVMPDNTVFNGGGHHRVKAMRQLGEHSVPARVYFWEDLNPHQKMFYFVQFPEVLRPHLAYSGSRAGGAVDRVIAKRRPYVEVPLDKIKPIHPVPWDKTLKPKPPNHVEGLMYSIMGEGFETKHAIPLLKMPDGALLNGGGHHRTEAMRRLQEKTIPAKIYEWNELPQLTREYYLKRFGEVLTPHIEGAPGLGE